MSLFARFRESSLTGLIKDQRLKNLVTRREFRISADYVRRELVPRIEGEEVQEVSFAFRDGYGELSARVKKRFVPFAIPFAARFVISGVAFTPREKKLHLRLEEVKPLDFDWLTRRLVEKVPFLEYGGEGLLVCDLGKVPQLAEMFEYRVRGVRISDFFTIKEIVVREGEVVGRVGVVL